MAEQFQKTLHGASQDGLPDFDNLKYLPIMKQVMKNPNLKTMAVRLGNALMQDPSMSSMLENFTNPPNTPNKEERMARIKEDPSLKHILDEIETDGPAAMMRYWNDEEVLKKLGLAMGINPNTGEAAASSDNPVPDETEDVGNEDESIVHQTACVGDVELILGRSLTRFEKDCTLLKEFVKIFINHVEDEDVPLDNSTLSIQNYMAFYKYIYELRRVEDDIDSQLLLNKYKKLFVKYINSKVLPSLRAKENDVLLREVLKRWSNHKVITCWLSRLFRSLETFGITEISLEKIGFLSFYDLVYEEVNNKVMDAILAMIDEDRAGKQIDRKLVNNILALYLEISDKTGKNDAKYFAEKIIKENATLISSDDEVSNWMAALSLIDNTPKEENLKSSKKIKVMSYDGDVFKIDYDVALMSKTLRDVIESYPNIGDIEDSIPLSNVKSASSKILRKIIEYCKKHKDEEESHMMEDWDAEFIDLDLKTVINLFSASTYLNIKSLRYLALLKIIDIYKGKPFHEFYQTCKDSMTDL